MDTEVLYILRTYTNHQICVIRKKDPNQPGLNKVVKCVIIKPKYIVQFFKVSFNKLPAICERRIILYHSSSNTKWFCDPMGVKILHVHISLKTIFM